MLTKEKLLEFCKVNKIEIAKSSTRERIEATIVRHLMDGKSFPNLKGCFGFWEKSNAVCVDCHAQNGCREASLGVKDRVRPTREV